jgi:hypothetical protein
VIKIAWTAPLTAVSGAILTAAQWNASVRDNFNASCNALVSAGAQILVATGANALAARTIAAQEVATSDTTTSATYTTNLTTTSGPVVTVTTGQHALVSVYCASQNSGTVSSVMSFEVSGASSISAVDDTSAGGNFGTQGGRSGWFGLFTGLTAGSNTFTAAYRVGSGTGTFSDRWITVIPL